jgi:L-methionine (R)-S-oxide reductase
MMGKPLAETKAMGQRECVGTRNSCGELSHLSRIPEGLVNLREQLRELAAMAVAILQAESCCIELKEDKAEGKSLADDFCMTFSAGGSASGKENPEFNGNPIDGGSHLRRGELGSVEPEPNATCSNSVMLCPILVDGRTIGVVKVEKASRKPHFNEEDEQTLSTVAALASCLHHAVKLHSKSDTQFVHISTGHQEITTISGMASLIKCPHEMARIVARLFYLEMTKAGFSQSQIIKVASEIISELSVSLRRHSKRMTSKIS